MSSNPQRKRPWFQRKSAAWGLTILAILFVITWLAGKLLRWPWPDGSDWQAIWTFFTFLVAAVAAAVALDQLSAHREAQRELSRPYVVVDLTFRSMLLLIEVRNIGQSPALNVKLTWDVEPLALDDRRSRAIRDSLVTGTTPFLAPGRTARYPIGEFPAYWADESMPKRFEVVAKYADSLGQSFGGNEVMILDLAQWAGTIVDTDYDRKIWNQLQHQTKSQQNIARNIASTDGQLAALQVAIANLGTELIVGRNRGANIGVTWAIVPVGRNERRITNVGTILAENVRVSDVTNDSGRSGFWLVDDALPRNVGVAEWICAVMERSLADPFQSCIQIQWVENGDPHEATYWIS